MRKSGVCVSSSRKWMGFVAAIWVECVSGLSYAFSNYSAQLKAVLGYNQLQLNNLGVAKDVGKAMAPLIGACVDYLPPWLILLIGSSQGLIGYGLQWLLLTQRLQPLQFWQMFVVMCFSGSSCIWMNTVVLVICVRIFPNSRGPVVGILKGYAGLSTAILTDLCLSIFSSDPVSFVLVLAVVPFAVCLIAMPFLSNKPLIDSLEEDEEKDKNCFFLFNFLAIALAIYLLLFGIFQPLGSTATKIYGAVLLGLLISPVVLPAKLLLATLLTDYNQSSRDRALSINGINSAEKGIKEGLLATAAKNYPNITCAPCLEDFYKIPENEAKDEHPQDIIMQLGDDHSLLQTFGTLDFWLLFFAFMCGIGPGMVVINNLGQIGEAQGCSNVSPFVALASIAGFFGRIGAGIVSEHFMRKALVPRPVWMAGCQILLLLAFLLLAFATPGSLYFGPMAAGLCNGVRLAITLSSTSEMFGLKHFGLIFNVITLSAPLSSFLFSGLLTGYLYDREAKRLHLPGQFPTPQSVLQRNLDSVTTRNGSQTCNGAHCFQLVFFIMAIFCSLGLLLDFVLVIRTKRLYRFIRNSPTRK